MFLPMQFCPGKYMFTNHYRQGWKLSIPGSAINSVAGRAFPSPDVEGFATQHARMPGYLSRPAFSETRNDPRHPQYRHHRPRRSWQDHLVDQLLRRAGTFRENQQIAERVMDSNDSKRSAGSPSRQELCGRIQRHHINIVDTPATLTSAARSSACCRWWTACCCWSTRLKARCRRRVVTRKALALGLKPIVVINKIDRPRRTG